MSKFFLDVAKEYYPRPLGRYYTDGKHSGERFRKEYLLPRLNDLKESDILIINFDGVSMAGSSFLEEAFGGLVRVEKFNSDKLLKKLQIEVDPELKELITDRIVTYIKNAGKAVN